MTHFRLRGPAAAVALSFTLLLGACGGGDDDAPATAGPPTTQGSFSAVVSFGDSLSDAGSYSPATSLAGNGTAPYFGGRFTTNTNDLGTGASTARVWVENVATALSIALTPHEVGFGAQSVKCPAAANPLLATSCTAYGQGGSRVTNPVGIGKSAGALTVPMSTQIANHLTRFGSFKDSDLVFVYGGNNDVLIQFSTFAGTAAQVQAQAAAGTITASQAQIALLTAQVAGNDAVVLAAQELAGLVRTKILANGGKYVAVMNLPDTALAPLGGSLPASARGVLTGFVNAFNTALLDGLSGTPVRIIDANAQLRTVSANPSAYGLVNITTPACDAAKISTITSGAVTDGSSLFCNATPGAPFNGLRAGADTQTWAFADTVHPTVGAHRIFSDYVLAQLRAFGWIV